jgi:hypothetical protein
MQWEQYLPSSQFIYEGVTSEELSSIAQDHSFTEVNGIKAIGTGVEIPELAAKQYVIPVVEQLAEEPIV